MGTSEKQIVLVLHHTYFHDTFRDYPDFTMERFEELKTNYFIARFIIEKKTDDENCDPAITSHRVYAEFMAKFEPSAKTSGAKMFLKILDRLVFKVQSDQINKLEVGEGVITIADKVFSTAQEYEPILIISSAAKQNFIKQAEDFYRATLKEKFTGIPFRIFDYKETEEFLRDKYPLICQMVDERTTSVL